MTMRSSDLLPALRGLPTGESCQRMSSRDMIAGLVNADRAMYAAEFVSVASFGTWAIFPGVNVDDDLRETMTQAHEMAFSNYEGTLIEHFQEITERGPESVTEFIGVLRGEAAVINAADALGFTNVDNVDDRLFVAFREAYRRLAADKSLYEQYRETAEGGENSITGLVNGLKGKMAEISIEKDKLLEQNGYTNVEMAKDATQEGWDFSGFNEAGEKKFFQVKTGGEGRVSEIINDMEANPDYIYPVTSKIYGGIAESRADLKDRLIDIGPDLDKHVRDELETLGHNMGLDIPDDLLDQLTDSPDYLPVEGINDGLETLSANMGIDIPDGIVDIIPYATVIGGGARLIYSVVKTEKEFKAVDRTTKNQIQVVQDANLDVQNGHHYRPGSSRRTGWSSRRERSTGHRQCRWRRSRHCNRRWYRDVPQQAPTTPHAEPCAEHHRANPRRSVLLQKQAAHQRSSLHIPDKGQRVGGRAWLIVC